MASFSDSPLEVIEEVIDALQDDITSLKACSQTCQSLLPLCRKQLFQTIKLSPRPWSPPQLRHPPRKIVLFGRLLDRNPGIANYVRNLVYQTEISDSEDDDVPRILGRLQRIQNFQLIGCMDWKTLRPPFRESLSKIIQSHSIIRLGITSVRNFPIATFIPCINLIDLTLTKLVMPGLERYEQENSMSEAIQLQSFSFGVDAGGYTKSLIEARHSNGLPVMDFSSLRALNIYVEKPSDLVVAHALITATEKLETLKYEDHFADGLTGLASSMNLSSLSTLRRLCFAFGINNDIQDPLCGLCGELSAFAGTNVIEEISLHAFVKTDCQCKTGNEWGLLDVVLANGFPKLCEVSLRIVIYVYSSTGIILQEKLSKLPEEQFPWLSKNMVVMFNFSTEVDIV